MALARLRADLENLVQSMYKEGVLDNQFAQIQALQDESNPKFVVEVVTLFCDDAGRILRELTNHLSQSDVDHYKLDAYVHQLKGSSSSIGAHRVKLACADFRQASDNKNKDRFQEALDRIKCEYYLLRSKFQTLVELEQRISACETNQQLQNAMYGGGSTQRF
ncbi:hypothetical protein L1049_007544 [Liquidambar formosana]|uniref:Histidine-containing phosphotransfer protein n=1 Tax=Liquidambar formosana TaxID=63359 RepID=A0AAP0X1K5_LIQFO